MIIRFTIEPKSAEGRGIEPQTPLPGRLVSTQCPEPIRIPSVFKWTHRESNPDRQSAELESSRWTMSPQCRGPFGVEPELRSYQASACCHSTYRPVVCQ